MKLFNRITCALLLGTCTVTPLKGEEECIIYPGEAYYYSRRSCYLVAGVAIGVALFVGMTYAVITDGHNSHHSH